MPAEARPHQVAAHCGDPKALVRFSQSGNQSRARQTRGAPVEQEQRPRNRDDCVVPSTGLRDDLIAGPIIMPIYVYLPLQQETPCDGAAVSEAHREESMRVQDSVCYLENEPVKSPAEPMVCGLSAGGRWIRTTASAGKKGLPFSRPP